MRAWAKQVGHFRTLTSALGQSLHTRAPLPLQLQPPHRALSICTHQELQGQPQPSHPPAHSSTPNSAHQARIHRPPRSPPSPLPASEGPLWVLLWPCQATAWSPPISHLPATLDSKRSLVLLETQPTTMRFEMRAGVGPALCTPPHPGLNTNAPHHCPSHLPGGTEQPHLAPQGKTDPCSTPAHPRKP